MIQSATTSIQHGQSLSNGRATPDARAERIRLIMRIAYFTGIAAGIISFVCLAVIRYTATVKSIEPSANSAYATFIGIAIASVVALSRVIALLWSSVDAARRRYISCTLGVVISVAFMWHELASVSEMCTLAGLSNDFVISSVRFTVIASLLIEARIIVGLFRW